MSRAEWRQFLILVVAVTTPGMALSLWAAALPTHDSLRRWLEVLAAYWFGLGVLICVAALARIAYRRSVLTGQEVDRPLNWTATLIDAFVPFVCCAAGSFLVATTVKQWDHDRTGAVVGAVLSVLCLLAAAWIVWLREWYLRRAMRSSSGHIDH